MHYPHVKYYLINPVLGRQLLNFEPINWNDDEKTLVRNEENWGVFTQLSNNLEFVKDGRRIIQEVFYTQGTEAELILERYVAETTSQGYELDYKGYLDLKTFSEQDEKVNIKFLSGGLQNLVESQFDEAYELERGTDINGNQITDLDFDKIVWQGRSIFLESLAETPEIENKPNGKIFHQSYGINDQRLAGYPYDMTTVYESEGIDIFNVFQGQAVTMSSLPVSPGLSPFVIQASGLVYVNNTNETKNFIINGKFDFFYKLLGSGSLSNKNNYHLVVGLGIYEYNDNNASFDWIENKVIKTNINWAIDINSVSDIKRWNDSFNDYELTLQHNQGILFTTYVVLLNDVNTFMFIDTLNWNFQIKITENSFFEPTEFKALKVWDAFNRMLEIYTSKPINFKSDYLKNGQFKDLLITSGKHIRNLPDAKISVQLKDLYELNNYFNLGWAVEVKNGIETFVVEPKAYFFQKQVIIDLGEVSDLEIVSKEDLLFKSMTFGNKKAGDYEEVQGLQEYNALTTFVSHLKTSDTKYEVDGNVRADLVGAELARRKNYSVAPNEDTRYDNENFLFDCKIISGTENYKLKEWQDVLSSEPLVYDPPTAGNLLLTPLRSMQRHANIFNAGMKVYQDKFTRYSTGTGKVETQTQLVDEPVYAENSDIQNNLLETPIFEAIEYRFKKPLSLEIKKKLRGFTNDIPNVNFLVKFAYKGERYTGWILEVSFNEPGEWKLIKSYN